MFVTFFLSVICGALITIQESNSLPTTMEKMTVSRMRMADLESSATGYVYNAQRGHPGSYVQYANHGSGRYYDTPAPIQYVTYRKPGVILRPEPGVITGLPSYKSGVSSLAPSYVVPLVRSSKQAALAPYYVPSEIHQNPHHVEIQDDDDSSDNNDDDSDENDEDENEHEEGEGENFNKEEQSSAGETGEEGYKKHHEFDNGEKGQHHKDKHEGHYSDKGGNKQSYAEDTGHYDNHDEAEKGNEGESYGQHAYHKKGHKTTGFHNVYRKDEYKKDTDFYDDDHKSGHYDKHSLHDAHHSSTDGDYKKGANHNSNYGEQHQDKNGYYDNGHEDSQHKGFNSEKGGNSYHKNHADYATKKGSEENKKYGYNNRHL